MKELTWNEVAAKLPKRDAEGHKGTFGALLVIGGSRGLAGAAYFTAEAAYRMGCGMVRIATPEENRIIYQTQLPEAVVSAYDENYEEAIHDAIKWSDAVVMGPGMGTNKLQRDVFRYAYERVKEAGLPILIDADGLNILSKGIYRLNEPHGKIILTPHMMEMSRLTDKKIDEIQADVPGMAKKYADKWDCVVHLKGAKSITAAAGSDDIYQNTTGNDGMATGGSGDVLSGIIGALLVQGVDPYEATVMGSYIHGLCGDTAAEQLGHESMLASDIIQAIQRVLRGLKGQ